VTSVSTPPISLPVQTPVQLPPVTVTVPPLPAPKDVVGTLLPGKGGGLLGG
jgi:hypothetical protein